MTNWYEILKSHRLVRDGMREDDSVRAAALKSMNLPPVFEEFNAVTNVTHNYDADDYEFDKFQNAYDNLPISVQTILHNAGVTHFLTSGEAERVVSSNELLPTNWGGVYYWGYSAAITETRSRSLESIARHEAGHGLSGALGTVDRILEPLAVALERDLKSLNSQEWQTLKELNVGYLSKLAWPTVSGGQSGLDALSRNQRLLQWPHSLVLTERLNAAKSAADAYTSLSPAQKNEIQQLLPDFATAVQDNDPSHASHFYANLSHHPAFIEAYQKDLEALLTGNGPNGASLGIDHGRAHIFVGGQPVLDVAYYVPEEHGGDGYTNYDDPEEPFAQIFNNLHDPMVGPNTHVLATYFPSMTAEVRGVLAALDRTYHNGKTPEPAVIKSKEPAAESSSSELGLTHQPGATSAFYNDVHQFLINEIGLEGMRAGTIATYLMNVVEPGQPLTAATLRETLSQFAGEKAVGKLDDFLAAARPSPPEAAPEPLHP